MINAIMCRMTRLGEATVVIVRVYFTLDEDDNGYERRRCFAVG